MSSLNGRKVAIVRIHQSTHATGVGTLQSPLLASALKTKGLIMTKADGGVLLAGKDLELLIPDANIASMELVPVKTASMNETDNKAAK